MNPILGGIFMMAGCFVVKQGALMLRDSLDNVYDIKIKTFQHMVRQTPLEKNYADEVVKTIVTSNEDMEHIRESELNARLSLDLHEMVIKKTLATSIVDAKSEGSRLSSDQEIEDIYREQRLKAYPPLFRPFAYL